MLTFKRKESNTMAMEGGGMIDFIMDIIQGEVEQAKAEDALRTKQEREQQKSNQTSSTQKNQER